VLRKNTRSILVLSLLLASHFLSRPAPASAASPADVKNDQPLLNFPESITFHADIESAAEINSVVLEYGTNQLTCGEVVAKAYPLIAPGKSVSADWTWEMKQSGSLPPGAQIWWRWRYVDQTGRETVSDRKTVTWLDSIHSWQTLSQGAVRLHYYRGGNSFGADLLNAAVTGLARVEKDAGLKAEQPVDLYIYADTNDLKDAVLYEPGWTGGEAFAENNIVILGIAPEDMDWGRGAIAHELTHVLVGHLTFSCISFVPTWLNEGLAVYSEGELDPYSQVQLDSAIQNDSLLTVRSLSGAFSEVADRATLSYSESYSIVKFLIGTHGRDKMTELLLALRDGSSVEDALVSAYGFDIEGLEDAWRASIGARARAAAPNPTAQPTPTYVPTIVPISGAPLAMTPTPFTFPTLPPADLPPSASGPPLSLTLVLLGICCALGLVLAVLILGVILATQRRKESSHEKGS
jgi:hypothetical protein